MIMQSKLAPIKWNPRRLGPSFTRTSTLTLWKRARIFSWPWSSITRDVRVADYRKLRIMVAEESYFHFLKNESSNVHGLLWRGNLIMALNFSKSLPTLLKCGKKTVFRVLPVYFRFPNIQNKDYLSNMHLIHYWPHIRPRMRIKTLKINFFHSFPVTGMKIVNYWPHNFLVQYWIDQMYEIWFNIRF